MGLLNRFPRIKGALTGAFPILKNRGGILGALFAAPNEYFLPPVRDEDGTVVSPATVVQEPAGILRDRANQSILVAGAFQILGFFNIDPWGLQEADVQTFLNVGSVLFTALAGVIRTLTKGVTRG